MTTTSSATPASTSSASAARLRSAEAPRIPRPGPRRADARRGMA
ncbi:hypothetical protein OG899_15735 [Streptomyces thermoviolaceus]|nr:hypothetical protein OG899_15735 [Streptomyces thermoviolaceus]